MTQNSITEKRCHLAENPVKYNRTASEERFIELHSCSYLNQGQDLFFEIYDDDFYFLYPALSQFTCIGFALRKVNIYAKIRLRNTRDNQSKFVPNAVNVNILPYHYTVNFHLHRDPSQG